MKKFTKCLSVAALAAFALGVAPGASAQPAPPIDGTHAIVVIDITGSMQAISGPITPGGPDLNRFQVGIELAREYLNSPEIVGAVNPEFAVWTFSGTEYVEVMDFGTRLDALTALDGIDVTSYATPLAGSVCDAVDALKAYGDANDVVDPVTGITRPGFYERRIFLATDGGENSTPSGHKCHGEDAVTDTMYPNYDDYSWQWKVRNMLRTEDPLSDTNSPFEYIVDVRHILTSFIQAGQMSAADDSAASAGLENVPFSSVPFATTAQDASFFRGLAQQSGGEYKQVAPNAAGVVLLKTPGDVDDNGCVDYADYNMVLQVYGMQVTNNHPLTYRADFDGNGWIDGDDYLAVLQNWGSGCVNAP